MNNPYRENPVQHTARLSEAEVKTAIRDLVRDRSAEDFSDCEVKLIVKQNAAKDGYEVTAEVIGPWVDES